MEREDLLLGVLKLAADGSRGQGSEAIVNAATFFLNWIDSDKVKPLVEASEAKSSKKTSKKLPDGGNLDTLL